MSELPFLPDRKKIRKIEKLVCGIEDKKNMSCFKAGIKSWIKINKCT